MAWDNDFAPGYDGMLNFMEHFWVVKGSRVYPPVPHITLNISKTSLLTAASSCKQERL